MFAGVYRGRVFWSGVLDAFDGAAQEVHTHAEAKEADYLPGFYFSGRVVVATRKGTSVLFWVDEDMGEVRVEPTITPPGSASPRRLMARLAEQIAVVPLVDWDL